MVECVVGCVVAWLGVGFVYINKNEHLSLLFICDVV